MGGGCEATRPALRNVVEHAGEDFFGVFYVRAEKELDPREDLVCTSTCRVCRRPRFTGSLCVQEVCKLDDQV
jgi:hypothetical protein